MASNEYRRYFVAISIVTPKLPAAAAHSKARKAPIAAGPVQLRILTPMPAPPWRDARIQPETGGPDRVRARDHADWMQVLERFNNAIANQSYSV